MRLLALLVAGSAVVLPACGSAPAAVVVTPAPSAHERASASPTADSPTPASTPSVAASGCQPVSSPAPEATWLTYRDGTYAFEVSYPPGFQFESRYGASTSEMLAIYWAVDKCYVGGYPPGQVEIGVFAYDADSLSAWVLKHSDIDCAGSNASAFIFGVSNMQAVTAAGRPALSFDDKASGCGGTAFAGHQTVFLLKTNHVFMLGWWAAAGRPDYAPTVREIASEMLATFSERGPARGPGV